MTPNPVTISVEKVVKQALELMSVLDIGSVVVEKDGKPVSILTQKDIIYALAHKCEKMKIQDFLIKCKQNLELKALFEQATVY